MNKKTKDRILRLKYGSLMWKIQAEYEAAEAAYYREHFFTEVRRDMDREVLLHRVRSIYGRRARRKAVKALKHGRPVYKTLKRLDDADAAHRDAVHACMEAERDLDAWAASKGLFG
jgi:hypothetical protein